MILVILCSGVVLIRFDSQLDEFDNKLANNMDHTDLKMLLSESITPIRNNFRKAEFVFRQRAPVEGIYSVIEGRIRLERNTIDGHAASIHHGKRGESFAEAALFSEHYDCNAIALAPSVLVMFPKAEVLKTLSSEPAKAIAYISMLSHHIKNLRSNLELRGIRSARERILNYFLQTADLETNTVELPFTFKDLSSHLGLAHETVYREIKKLEMDSIIERDENIIRVKGSV